MSERILLGTPAQGTRILGIPLARASAGSAAVASALAGWAGYGTAGLLFALLVIGAGALGLAYLHRSTIYPGAWLRLVAKRHRGGFVDDGGYLATVGTARTVLAFRLELATPRLFGRIEGEEGVDWVRLLTVTAKLAAGFRGGARVALSTSILPSLLRSSSPPLLEPVYEVVSRLTLSPRSKLNRTELERLGTCAQQLSALSSELATVRLVRLEGGRALLESSVASLITGVNSEIVEREDRLELAGSVASVLMIKGWGEASPPPGLLAPLFAATPPARLMGVVLDPLEARRAFRTVGRARAEQEADSRLLRQHGYLERLAESARTTAAALQEERLLAGYALARFQIVSVVLAPNRAGLRRELREMIELGLRCNVEFAVALGHQREWFELATAGVEGWS